MSGFPNGDVPVGPIGSSRKPPEVPGIRRDPPVAKIGDSRLESANLLAFAAFVDGAVEVRIAQWGRPSGPLQQLPEAPGS